MAKKKLPTQPEEEKVDVHIESWHWESPQQKWTWKKWVSLALLIAVALLFAFGFLIVAGIILIVGIVISLFTFLLKRLT